MKKVQKQKDKETISTAVVISALEKEAKPLFNKLKKIEVIETAEDLDFAGKQMKLLKSIGKQAEAKMDTLTEDLYTAIEKIKGSISKTEKFFEPFQDKIKTIEISIKQLITEYYDRQDKLIEKVEEDFSTGKIKKVGTYTAKVSAAQVVSTKGGAVRKQSFKLNIIDVSKIPREYLVPDEKLIEAALKEGKKVPGAELKKVNSVAI